MTTLKVLGGGAAHGLVTALTDEIEAAAGTAPTGDYGPVGGMRDRVVAGEAVDVIILTKALIADLVAAGIADAGTVADIGSVATGVAVREGVDAPDITSSAALASTLQKAEAIFVPDMTASTAGRHVASVLRDLDPDGALAGRVQEFPGGLPAMKALASSDATSAIGLTQVTEIMNSGGVTYCGPLPAPHGLDTIYTAAVATNAQNAPAAREMVRILTAPEQAPTRKERGFG